MRLNDLAFGAMSSDSTQNSKNTQLQTDRPIESAAEDLFDRRGFATRVGEVIASRRDPSSLVIGIYGPWGDGKTSTLNMIQEILDKESDLCSINYNPWEFGDSRDAITRSFWEMLRDVVDESIIDRQKAGAAAASLAKLIPQVGDAVAGAIEKLTTKGIREARKELSNLLENSKRRIIVFVDDIDRLERREIQTLFRLIRLSADFPKIVYLLAFDDEVVSASLGDAYGDGGAEAGRKFLEKIVQVPLRLPPADSSALRDIVFRSCERVLDGAGITISSTEAGRIANAITGGFSGLIRTPRQAKLFDNAISFAVPILKGEVNAGDQILIEGMRIFTPSLFADIRDNQMVYLSSASALGKEEHKKRDEEINRKVAEISTSETQCASIRHQLLEELFPRISDFSHGRSSEAEWARDRRICSGDYFRRYFLYGIPKGDFADAEIDLVIANAAEGLPVIDSFREAQKRKALEIFVRKIRQRQEAVPSSSIPGLLRALGRISNEIPTSDSRLFGAFELTNAALLASDLLKRLPTAEQDRELIAVAEESTSVSFSVETVGLSAISGEWSDRKGWLDSERVVRLFRRIATRFCLALSAGDVSKSGHGSLKEVLGTVRHFLGKGEADTVGQALKAWILLDPANASFLVRQYAGNTYTANSVRVSDFKQTGYDSITFFVDGNTVVSQLRIHLGTSIEAETYEEWFDKPDQPDDLRLARQFYYLNSRRNLQNPRDHA